MAGKCGGLQGVQIYFKKGIVFFLPCVPFFCRTGTKSASHQIWIPDVVFFAIACACKKISGMTERGIFCKTGAGREVRVDGFRVRDYLW